MEEKRTRVYIPNKSSHDFSDAKRFGELVYITEGFVDRFNTNYMYRAFMQAFEESNAEDYILVSSMNILNCIGTACFARKHGRVNLLLFRRGEYVERILDIDALMDSAV